MRTPIAFTRARYIQAAARIIRGVTLARSIRQTVAGIEDGESEMVPPPPFRCTRAGSGLNGGVGGARAQAPISVHGFASPRALSTVGRMVGGRLRTA